MQDSLSSVGARYSDTSISTSTTGDTFGFAEYYHQVAPQQLAAKRNLRGRKALKPPPLPPKPRMLEELERGRSRHPSALSTSPVRCGSSLSLERSSSRGSLADIGASILNSSFGSPKAVSSPKDPEGEEDEDPLYAKIAKRPFPLPQFRGARKRVCFRDAMSLSSIQEASPINLPRSAASALFPAQENLRHHLSPVPFKSPARPQPKTNPHFGGTPRLGTTSRGSAGRLSLRSFGGGSLGRHSGDLWRQERFEPFPPFPPTSL